MKDPASPAPAPARRAPAAISAALKTARADASKP
mgnify:CR=1 FL=1